MTDSTSGDHTDMIVVPRAPGPLVPLGNQRHNRDDIDEAIDEIFGQVDDSAPGVGDALLVVVGAGLIVTSQIATVSSAVLVFGILSLGLGCILPLRWLAQQTRGRIRGRKVEAIIGDGFVLRSDHSATQHLVAAYDQVVALVEASHTPEPRFLAIAHAHMTEVAAVLEGHSPTTRSHVNYVTERTESLKQLALVLDDRANTGSDRQQALLDARLEVEALDSASSLTEAAALLREFPGQQHG